ncbi:hypothetical protein, partial [Mycobacterium avium]
YPPGQAAARRALSAPSGYRAGPKYRAGKLFRRASALRRSPRRAVGYRHRPIRDLSSDGGIPL